jgi:hypothetical protein
MDTKKCSGHSRDTKTEVKFSIKATFFLVVLGFERKLARQALYHLSHSASPEIFKDWLNSSFDLDLW